MAAIQWRPDVNPLTIPQSYLIRFMPHNVAGSKDIAKDIARMLPMLNVELIEMILGAEDQAIMERLINGEQVTRENICTWTLSFTGKLNSPDDPLPDLNESLQVRMYPSPAFVAAVRQAAQTERLPMAKKVPLIATAADTLLKLNDMLNADGVLQLTGSDLFFDPEQTGSECVIAGTQSGRAVQTRLLTVTNSTLMLMPTIPEQEHPWHNEYTVSVSTRYSKNGTVRTGTYERMLRTPLTWDGFAHEGGRGILTDNAEMPYVTIESGVITANTTLRVQAVLDLRDDRLLFNLRDMKENGSAGAEVAVTENGEITLPGFAGSAVSSMSLEVHDYATLKDMIRSRYGGRLADIIQIELA